eukprot:scaffold15514_cov129-Cylindrotheca_fusiformis.AAC.16
MLKNDLTKQLRVKKLWDLKHQSRYPRNKGGSQLELIRAVSDDHLFDIIDNPKKISMAVLTSTLLCGRDDVPYITLIDYTSSSTCAKTCDCHCLVLSHIPIMITGCADVTSTM